MSDCYVSVAMYGEMKMEWSRDMPQYILPLLQPGNFISFPSNAHKQYRIDTVSSVLVPTEDLGRYTAGVVITISDPSI